MPPMDTTSASYRAPMDTTMRDIMVCGGKKKVNENLNVRGTLVLVKKNVLGFKSSFLDRVYEIFDKRVSIQLISANNGDPSNGMKGLLSRPATLKNWGTKINLGVKTGDSHIDVWFEWNDESMGLPGAFLIKNQHHSPFFLKSLTLENVVGCGRVHFDCNSWVYPSHCYRGDNRIFFANKTYLPCGTPETLAQYRKDELKSLRGDGSTRGLKEWDRVYGYAFYDDLGTTENEYVRRALGGSREYPYPRRGRTIQPRNNNARGMSRISENIYLPRDELLSDIKLSDVIAYAVKSIPQMMMPEIRALFGNTPNESNSFEDVIKLYEDLGPADRCTRDNVRESIKCEMLRELLHGRKFHKFPVPDVIKENKSAWQTDEEFGREMLAGVNPVVICQLKEFPPASKLDPSVYGNQTSTISRQQIETNMGGLSVEEAIRDKKLFILNHHDTLMPYLRKINSTASKVYASRTVLLLQGDETLKPLAIELSLPHPNGDGHGFVSEVFTPAQNGIEGSIWQLTKAYAIVNDSAYHQIISHWLNTHAVIEPFVIATNRQLSVIHPIHKLLHPHFRGTMKINALARKILLNAGGVLEKTVFPAKYSMEMSSVLYKDWNFAEQALPADLLKRGVAVVDPGATHNLSLLIKDYPYAVDGLEIWFAIESWVREYCSIYYSTNDTVINDIELTSWWDEIRLEGHGDKKHEPWWPTMQTRESLINVCTIIIWIASGLHAAVNFGQYAYAGYLPNRPTISRKLMPQPGTPEYTQLENAPESVFLETFISRLPIIGVLLIETLSRHSSNEIYLGQRECSEWTSDGAALRAFERFRTNLMQIQTNIRRRNDDETLKNRNGPVKMPYMSLYPNLDYDYSRKGGLTGMGIPNSVSI